MSPVSRPQPGQWYLFRPYPYALESFPVKYCGLYGASDLEPGRELLVEREDGTKTVVFSFTLYPLGTPAAPAPASDVEAAGVDIDALVRALLSQAGHNGAAVFDPSAL